MSPLSTALEFLLNKDVFILISLKVWQSSQSEKRTEKKQQKTHFHIMEHDGNGMNIGVDQ